MAETIEEMACRQRFFALNNALRIVEYFAQDSLMPVDMKRLTRLSTKLRNKYKV